MPKQIKKCESNENSTFPIRDPLYGFVELTSYERNLLKCKFVQRLTRIKQLGHTSVVYPSAVHTRFEHSLGVLYVAGRICEQIRLQKNDAKIVRCGALLHDVGHGPFSHVFEKVVNDTSQERLSHGSITKLILENDAEVKKCLEDLADEIPRLFDGEKGDIKPRILSSPLDADRLDYLRRDSYHTGVAYGVFDFERVVRNLCVISDEEGSYLGIHEKGRDAVESFRMARYLMYTQVYEHHTRLVAEDMFLRAVKLAIDEGVLSRELLNPKNPKFLDYYLSLDDNSIQHIILTKSEGKARKVIDDLQNRRLLKRAYVITISAEAISDYRKRQKLMNMKQEEIDNLENKIASEAGLDVDELIIHLQSTEVKLYERPEESMAREEEPILIKNYDSSVKHIGEESPFSASVIPKRLYVFCSGDIAEKVSKIAESIIGVGNCRKPRHRS